MNTKIVILTHGLKVGEKTYKNLKFRESFLDDLCEAETEADPRFAPVAYRRAHAAVLLVSADDFTGPFTGSMLGKLKNSDWRRISAAIDELDALGEPEPAAGETS